ncbi:hypothetical protein COV06_00875 [Candidatus Uhrbacteria bacterium CG10_big_fil_rev_8_21_14_0_10_50_16]|uniref:Glycosyltransferase n=1 Tax=Candidatus Uhrbacteria bacterium CG10_big_fil_rev_8_21_14_0_10_50_16 TaxID=1975039 RepID=A0A2H0RN07_9BACT|nr:MAG: hypothetical protein COV06_00875 [Candidatus Uhrbacteria bacterium CG10_big_fil_rev_8_21_14_0_10_50_16]
MNTAQIDFFDIPIDRLTQRTLELRLSQALDELGQVLIATPNPEMLLAAHQDEDIARILRRMHMRIPDGFGLSLLSRLTGQGTLRRFPGVDVLLDICRLAGQRNMHLLIIGGWGEDSARASTILETAFPGLRVSSLSDMRIHWDLDEWNQPGDLLSRVQQLAPDVLAIALGGAGYSRQERWIVDHAPQFPSVRVAIGVGGAVDMISGRIMRAPIWMRAIGLEWLWRVLRQPSRIHRIYDAVIRFPIAAILDRLTATRGDR